MSRPLPRPLSLVRRGVPEGRGEVEITMSRIQSTFRELRRWRRKALIPFIVAGDPSLAATGRLLPELEKAGADLIELGIPFSDPMADGPVIQRADERALRRGATLKKILRLVASVRRRGLQIPIVLMGYYNPILAYGLKRFAREAGCAGVDGILVVDLPPEESGELDVELRRSRIDRIYLLAPTSDRTRIQKKKKKGSGYLYFVSMTGITGARLNRLGEVRSAVQKIKRQTRLPVVVGFGIRNRQQVNKIVKFSDGVVIGSSLIERLSVSAKKGIRFFRCLR